MLSIQIAGKNIQYSWDDDKRNRELYEGDIEEINEAIEEGIKEGVIEQFDFEKDNYVQCSWKIVA